MNARQFYDLVVAMREAQKNAGTTLNYEDIQRTFALEEAIDKEIERVTLILNQRNDEHQHRHNEYPNPR